MPANGVSRTTVRYTIYSCNSSRKGEEISYKRSEKLHDDVAFCLKNGSEAATRDAKCIYLVLLMRSVALAVSLVFVISASICDVHSKH